MWPDVTIGIITYARPEEIVRTVTALRENLHYSGQLHFVAADDSSPDRYVEKLKRSKLFKEIGTEFISTPENGGWGINANHLLQHVSTQFLFQIEDDYVLTQPLNLDAGMALLLTKPHIGMLRYRGTAGDHVVLHQMEADVSAFLPEYREGTGLPGKLTYCLLDSGSPTVWLYSNGPHLKRRDFHQFYGDYPEGLKLGVTEEKYAHIVRDGMKTAGAPAIAILPDTIKMIWEHIGHSYQGSEFDKGEE